MVIIKLLCYGLLGILHCGSTTCRINDDDNVKHVSASGFDLLT